MQNFFRLYLYLSFFILRARLLSDYVRVEQRINLQLTGKISLKLDSKLLLEYGR